MPRKSHKTPNETVRQKYTRTHNRTGQAITSRNFRLVKTRQSTASSCPVPALARCERTYVWECACVRSCLHSNSSAG